MRVAGALLMLVLVAATATAQPTLQISRVAAPPDIKDYLDGSAPAGQTPVTNFIQRDPVDAAPATQRTEVYLSYDDRHFYAVFVCHDTEPGKIRARLTRREDFGGDDFVGILLDTFHDRRRSYAFITNPLGIQLDGVTAEGQGDDFTFDTLWKSEGYLTDFGYVVRMEIPFRSLRFPAAPAQTWGFAVARSIPRANETSFWPYITNKVAGFVQQLATLEGLERISPGRNIQLIPYGTFAGARFLDAPGRYATDADGRVGLDAKFVLRDAFALDLTLNPDFSQVESDEPQVTINQRFEVFFPERRPFFIENANYFETPINLVFSRRIADPQFGTRLTGKAGGWALGALVIDDRAPGRRLAPGEPAFGDRTGVGIVRAQREFGEQSTIGFLATSRDFGSSFSRVASTDGRVKLNDNWIAEGQAIVSHTGTLGAAAITGGAVMTSLRRSSRTWGIGTEYRDITPDFRVPLGFVRRVDIRELEQSAYRNWRPGGRVLQLGPELFVRGIWDHDGVLQDWSISPDFSIGFAGQTDLEVEHQQLMERFEGTEFRKHSTGVSVSSERLRWLGVSAGFDVGTEINFFPGSGIAPFLADEREASARITLRPRPQLRIEQRYLFSTLSLRGAIAGRPLERAGDSIFSNHILRTRVNYQFSRPLSMRAILDYSTVAANSELIDESRARGLTADLLFTYLLNPGTAVYVGYTDRYADEDVFFASRLRSSGRQVFVKASYLVRF